MNAMKYETVHHVGFVVADLEETVHCLETQLGHLNYTKYSFKPMKAFCCGREIENYELKIAMISFGEGRTNIEVIEPVSEGYHMDFVKKTEGGGINHICFAVSDYEETKKKFESENAKIVFESETEDELIGYRRCFYAEDLLGNVVEIKENPYFRK